MHGWSFIDYRNWNYWDKDSWSYEKILVQILDRQVRKLRIVEIVTVKVIWRNQVVEEATRDKDRLYTSL